MFLLRSSLAEPCPPPAPPTPPPSQFPELELRHDETIINPHYMRQLLMYGLKMGTDKGMEGWSDERMAAEAEVRKAC